MHAGHVIKCVTFLNTSNSTKTQNVDMSYQTFFFPSKISRNAIACHAHKERLWLARLTFNMNLHGGLRLIREFRYSGGDHT